MIQSNSLRYAYIAGIADGEAYFGIKKTSEDKSSCENGRPLYCYQISDRAAEKFLESIFQYLIVKRKQAEVIFNLRVLQFCARKTKITGYRAAFGRKDKIPNYSYSDDYIKECEELYLKCKDLNKVGRND